MRKKLIFCCFFVLFSFASIGYSLLPNESLVASISPSSATIELGQSQLFTSIVSGGTPPYNYQWVLNDIAVPGATDSSWTFVPASSGAYNVYLNVTDNVGVSAKSNVALVIVELGFSVSILPSSAVVIGIGQSQPFTSSISEGTPPYSYQWYLADTPVPGAISPTWTFSSATAGSYNVYLKVTDATSKNATSNIVPVTVVNYLTTLSIDPAQKSVLIGQNFSVNIYVSNVTNLFAYEFKLTFNANVLNLTGPPKASIPQAGTFMVPSDGANKFVYPWLLNETSSYSPPYQTAHCGYTLLAPELGKNGSGVLVIFNFTAIAGGSTMLDLTSDTLSDPMANPIPHNRLDGLVTVSQPLSVSISPTSTMLDVGQSQLFTSTVTGGIFPYSYQWYLNGAPVSGGTNSTWTFAPAYAGAYNVYLNVTDNVGTRVKSNVATASVHWATSVAISPVSAVMDVGQSRQFTSTVSNGTSPYTYQWYLNGTPVSGATSASWTFVPNTAGAYSVHANVTDAVYYVAKSNVASVIVNQLPSITISPSSTIIDLGQFQLFTSTATGGTAPYTYQWFSNGTAIGGATSSTYTFVPLSRGHYYIHLRILDNVGISATSANSSVIVNNPPTVTIFPTSRTIDVGQSQLFSSTVLDGTAPFTYQWYLNDAPVPEATNATWTFVPISQGSYNVFVNVTDSVNIMAKSNLAVVTVNPPPSVMILPTSVVMDAGQSQLFNSLVSGGTSPFGYQWYLNGVAVSGATSATWIFTPEAAGLYDIFANVTDNVGLIVKSNVATATANPPVSVEISPASVLMQTEQSQLFTSIVTDGTPPYSYQWYLDELPVAGATSSEWSFVPTISGTYHVRLAITDFVGGSAESNVSNVTVTSGVHDISLTGIVNSKSGCTPLPTIGQNFTLGINVTAFNSGGFSENFEIIIYANETEIGRKAVIGLNPGATAVSVFDWNTTGFPKGKYVISAYAEPVAGETNTADNSIVGETVAIVIQGDVIGDGVVDIIDIVKVAGIFGSERGDQKYNPNADLNDDGIIDIIDVVIVAAHFGETS